MFVELDNSFKLEIKLGDEKVIKGEGKSVVNVYTKKSNKKLIHDIFYVPCLSHNLLSVGQLLQRGYSLLYGNGECKIVEEKNSVEVPWVKMTVNKYFPFSCHQVRHLLSKV